MKETRLQNTIYQSVKVKSYNLLYKLAVYQVIQCTASK